MARNTTNAGGGSGQTDAEKSEADRIAADRQKAGADGQKNPPEGSPAPATSPLVIFAKRAMWRAGRAWTAGRNELTADEVLGLGRDKLQLVHDDPNFTIAQPGQGSVVMADLEGQPVDAHVIVMAKRAMWRGGRSWNAGATPLDEEQAAELGDKLDQVKADPNFTVIERQATAPAAG